MLRTLIMAALVIALAVALLPQLVPALTWVLAFLSLLIAGDLLWSSVRRFPRRTR